MTGLRKYVQENAEYVGPKFAEEARKIHYGETAERHIYGEATSDEAQELVDEGVDVAPAAAGPRRAPTDDRVQRGPAFSRATTM